LAQWKTADVCGRSRRLPPRWPVTTLVGFLLRTRAGVLAGFRPGGCRADGRGRVRDLVLERSLAVPPYPAAESRPSFEARPLSQPPWGVGDSRGARITIKRLFYRALPRDLSPGRLVHASTTRSCAAPVLTDHGTSITDSDGSVIPSSTQAKGTLAHAVGAGLAVREIRPERQGCAPNDLSGMSRE
jgi:hypothetical protein